MTESGLEPFGQVFVTFIKSKKKGNRNEKEKKEKTCELARSQVSKGVNFYCQSHFLHRACTPKLKIQTKGKVFKSFDLPLLEILDHFEP